MTASTRADRERLHGERLAEVGAERAWGWGTPAGRLRALRRGDLIASRIGLRAGMGALELGCGTGQFTAAFARTGARIVAIDLSEPLLEQARQRGLSPSQVEFRCGRFEDFPFPDVFDAVIGSSVLHHLDVDVALPRIFELLKPGGRLGFAEPNLLNPQVFLERYARGIKPLFPYVSPDETAFVRWTLAKRLTALGFVEIDVVPFDWLHPLTPRWAMEMVQRAGAVLERVPVVREFAGSLLITARRPIVGSTR